MENKIFFNFSYLALRLLGSGLYSNPWNAISELVANGFDAGAKNVYIYINRTNKEKSVIELFDDGSGMTYDELVNKYVFVGRNKRLEEEYKNNGKIKALGRKGIGKLATLYLSDNVNIISNSDEGLTAWNLNITELNEDDKPALIRIESNDIQIDASAKWNSIKKGLLLRLNDVNLTGLGEKTLNGLINRLSDFYLLNDDTHKIWLAYTDESHNTINFKKVEKEIAYKNFYALFNNDEKVTFKDYLNHKVKVKTECKELEDGYPVISLTTKEFELNGTDAFLNIEGKKIIKNYELKGWIGIHTSINSTEATKNDERFLKNRATSPNKLRLYVREKLAIDNFLDYVKNTQAFSNYIEGEISFDILDDDDLPDIATANRQQLSEKDERVQLLIELIKPIINKLISLRVKLGNTIKKDEELIRQKKAEEISIKHQKELDQLQKEKSDANKEVERRVKQVDLLAKGLRKNEVRLAESIHTISKNSTTIDRKVNLMIKHYGYNEKLPIKLKREISNIKIINQKTIILTKYAFKGKFDLNSKIISTNIGSFIDQYIDIITETSIKKNLSFDQNPELKFCFDTTVLGIIIDNIVSNAEKAEAECINGSIELQENKVVMIFFDDGLGYNHDQIKNPEILFELGYRESNRPGLGIGLYHIKELVEKNGGYAKIDQTYIDGFKIIIEMISECS